MKKKGKVRYTFYISKRLFNVINSIAPLFRDFDLREPSRGAMTRALESILQFYSETEEYQRKLKRRKDKVKFLFDYLCKKDKEYVEEIIRDQRKKN